MPKRQDLKKILIIGSGPIVIGQACEFDYSGVQACKALREHGFEVILVNSNPATIMTDPGMADVTYIEPIHWRAIEKIIAREKPCAVLSTMGGQTALNCSLDLVRHGVLEKHNVELIGASRDAIDTAEDREKFGKAMQRIGLETPRAGIAHSMKDAWKVLDEVGYPAIIRPSFTMGGAGGGIAYNREEFETICRRGFDLSPTNELLIDESVIGWKEYELEVVRDKADNCIIVCSIENLDPMGIHTGDSITVAPAQTLTDKEYQRMRNAAMAILREVGVETGGSNVQFAINPADGRMLIVEMNPRVSRSSALASKATGFPIAKVAALCAVGMTLDEIKNDITGGRTPASFEPSIDYVVTKIPRFNFEKFPHANAQLTTQMKSVGEVMAIGRSFKESLQKAIRGLEIDMCGLEPIVDLGNSNAEDIIMEALRNPGAKRLWYLADAFRLGKDVAWVHNLTFIDKWYLEHIYTLVQAELTLAEHSLQDCDATDMLHLKRQGFSDKRISQVLQTSTAEVRDYRHSLEVFPKYKRIDTCAAEFPTETAYMYSTYAAEEDESEVSQREKIIVLGGGPNRIGQGIEFDYCCVHAAIAMRDLGYEAIMINCNPETVSTDFDISDRLYFEPLTLEDVLEVVRQEQPKGMIVQFGGQTPLKLAMALKQLGVPIIGTSPEAINRAEDREQFQDLVHDLELQQPPNGTVRSVAEGQRMAKVLAYPLVVRPSFVLGGRAMRVVYNQQEFNSYLSDCSHISAEAPLLLDHFLDAAVEVDVDAVSDGEDVLIGGILEHIEQAGIHSGDSSCTLPPHSLSEEIQNELKDQVRQLAIALGVVGLINVQFAIQNNNIYLLEVNPRSSRTVPFIAKATGVSLVQIAAKAMAGIKLADQNIVNASMPFFAVKQAVFPFAKFPEEDPRLGPEMRSTGEVMGIDTYLGQAFAKAQWGSGHILPQQGKVFVSVRDQDKDGIVELSQDLKQLGFEIVATKGTASTLQQQGIKCSVVNKVSEGRPHVVDSIKNGEIDFIINISKGRMAASNSAEIRKSAILNRICYTTTLAGARAAILAMRYADVGESRSLQELHKQCLEAGNE